MNLTCHRCPELRPSCCHVISEPVLRIVLGSQTVPLSAIARAVSTDSVKRLAVDQCYEEVGTALGISPAVGGQQISWQRSHGHLGSRIDSMEVSPVSCGLSSG